MVDNNPNNPLVSVLMAAYNNGPYLYDSIQSVLCQTYCNIEVIFINDGSTDETPEILKQFNDTRLKVYNNPKRMGVAAARNRSMKIAKGEYFAIADADDTYANDRIEKQVNCILNNNVEIIVSDLYHTNEYGVVIKLVRIPRTDRQIKLNFLWENPISHSTTLIKKETALKVGGYNEELDSSIDTDWFARLIDFAHFKVIHQPLHYYRRHSESISNNRDDKKAKQRRLITHQLMSKYFNGQLTEDDGLILKDLICSYTLIDPPKIGRGIELFDQFLKISFQKEKFNDYKWVKKQLSNSLFRQATIQSYLHPSFSLTLILKSLKFCPLTIFKHHTIKQFIRIIIAYYRRKNNK